MSILDLDLSDAKEPTVVPANQEYQLVITKCEAPKQDKSGFDYIMPVFEIPKEPNSKSFSRYIRLATRGNLDKLDDKKKNDLKWGNTVFLKCFGIDTTKKFSPEDDLPGKKGWAILGVESDEEYGDKNKISKFVVPK